MSERGKAFLGKVLYFIPIISPPPLGSLYGEGVHLKYPFTKLNLTLVWKPFLKFLFLMQLSFVVKTFKNEKNVSLYMFVNKCN